jgi:hypothetical protein
VIIGYLLSKAMTIAASDSKIDKAHWFCKSEHVGGLWIKLIKFLEKLYAPTQIDLRTLLIG